MKITRQQIKNQFNNVLHVILMFSILYLIGVATEFSEFTTEAKIIAIAPSSYIIGWVLGFFLEYGLAKLMTDSYSRTDMILYATGGLIGGVVSIFYINLSFLCFIGISLCFIAAIVDIIIYHRNKRK